MKSLRKKFVSVATLAAFAITLLPVAAFAAPTAPKDVAPARSQVGIADGFNAGQVDEMTKIPVEIKAVNGFGYEYKGEASSTYPALPTEQYVYVWAEDNAHNVVKDIHFYQDGPSQIGGNGSDYMQAVEFDGGIAIKTREPWKINEIAFGQAGNYTINAAIKCDENAVDSRMSMISEDQNFNGYFTSGNVVVNVGGSEIVPPTPTPQPQPQPEDPNTPDNPPVVTGDTVVMTINSYEMLVNDQVVMLDQAPYVTTSGDRTMVPVRAVAEAFGAKVGWDGATGTVTIDADNHQLIMQLGYKNYTLDGEEHEINVAPFVVNNRTVLPVRFVAESLGYNVEPVYNDLGLTSQVIFTK